MENRRKKLEKHNNPLNIRQSPHTPNNPANTKKEPTHSALPRTSGAEDRPGCCSNSDVFRWGKANLRKGIASAGKDNDWTEQMILRYTEIQKIVADAGHPGRFREAPILALKQLVFPAHAVFTKAEIPSTGEKSRSLCCLKREVWC